MSEHVYEFSFSRMDLPRLERYFEMRAGKGKMITRLSGVLGSGVFEDIFERNYHFCVRPYERLLDDGALRSEEFTRFKKEFEERGWTFQCGLMNLAVFYSKDDERPAEPDTPWEEQRERLMRVTERAELRYVMTEILAYTVCITLILHMLMTSGNGPYAVSDAVTPALRVTYLAANLVLIISVTAFRALPHFQMRNALRRGERSPERLPFWDRLTCLSVNVAAFVILEASTAWSGGRKGTLALCILQIALVSAILIWRSVTHKKAKPPKWEVYSRWLGVAVVVLLAIVIAIPF